MWRPCVRAWHRLLCRLGRCRPTVYAVGSNVGKECAWCCTPKPLTTDEIRFYFFVDRQDQGNEVAEEETPERI
jgi:hypothetical protein